MTGPHQNARVEKNKGNICRSERDLGLTEH
jgi:hypothetical protein